MRRDRRSGGGRKFEMNIRVVPCHPETLRHQLALAIDEGVGLAVCPRRNVLVLPALFLATRQPAESRKSTQQPEEPEEEKDQEERTQPSATAPERFTEIRAAFLHAGH